MTRPSSPPEADGAPGSSPPASDASPRSADEKVDPLLGTILAGRYRVERLLGSGGMGAVYRAAHVHMRKLVALKVLHREMTYMPEVVARFEREAVAAARIEHPNVAAATDFGRLEDGTFYLVLEYVEGQSLGSLLASTGPLPAERALHITRQIADALGAAHAADIVHRDLKPDNVMLVEREGERDFVKVLDFGIAKVRLEGKDSQQLTQLGTIFGTPQYMSPEQAAGQVVDARSDLYTLGLILYEMLSGASPFNDDDMIVLLTRQMTAPPPPLPSDVPPAVRALVERLLAKAPAQRYGSAAELIAAIDGCLSGSLRPGPLSGGQPGRVDELGFSATVLNVPGPAPGAIPAAQLPRVSAERSSWIVRAQTQLTGWVRRSQTVLTRRLTLRGRVVPVWALAVPVLALLVVVGALTWSSAPDVGPAAASAPPSLAERIGEKIGMGPSLDDLMRRARTGDRTALAELVARPDAERSAQEWLALGHGQAKIYLHSQSVESYRQAVAKDAALGADPELLGNVRQAALSPASSDAAFALLQQLGPQAAEVLYALATETDPKQAAVAKRAEQLLDTPEVRKQVSPALDVLLKLRRAKGCVAYKKLLPDVEQHGDERAAARLKKITAVRKGCGFFGLEDCYSCLRAGKTLQQALSAAEARRAPSL